MPRFEIPRVRPGEAFFAAEDDWWHNAVLQKYDPSWAVYAGGYRLAADAAVDAAKARRHEMDAVIYPIIFLYRQYLEISLKEILLYAEELRDGDLEVRQTHNLLDLWNRCKTALNVVSDGSLDEEVSTLDHAVSEFATLDPTSYAYRYPVDRTGEPVKHLVERINIRRLKDEMRNAAVAVDMISGGLSALVDQKREFLAEQGP